MRTYIKSLDPHLPRDVYVLEAGALVNAFGNGVVLPFLLIYLHNVRGIPFGLAGLAAAEQSAAALVSGFVAGTSRDGGGSSTPVEDVHDLALAAREAVRLRHREGVIAHMLKF